MAIRYCLPIQLQSHKAVREAARAATNFDFIEVWVSCIQNPDMDDIRRLMSEFTKKLILVLHPKHGQQQTLTPGEKIDILKLAAHSGVLVDLDITGALPVLEQMKREHIHPKLILSHHNFALTPNIQTLRNIIRRMDDWNPAVYKIATFCRNPDDAMVLLELLIELRKKNKSCIILGMGPSGAATRVFGTLWGNEMIFAPKTAASLSAPGQLTKRRLQIIFSTLGKK